MYKKIGVWLLLVLVVHAKPLVVGTNAEFPPFTFKQKGELVGFDIDVAKEVGKRLNEELIFKDMPFEALIPALMVGSVDFVAAGMSSSKERAERVSFTQSYIAGDPLVILTKVQHQGPLSLESFKTIVVNEGYSADLYLSQKPGLNLIRLPSPADAFLALNSGRADGFVTAQSTVRSFLKTQDGSKFRYEVIPGTGETCALIVSKKNGVLLDKIQTALDSMIAEGKMAELKTKWELQ